MGKTAKSKKIITSYNYNALNKGKILEEFRLFIDFVKTYRVEVTEKNNTIKKNFLLELNKILTSKLHIELKQPNQRSFPHIDGLFLLSRALGLCIIEFYNGKFFLTIDEEILKQWQELSNTEKYYNLLIRWFANGHPEIIGSENSLAIETSILIKSYIEDVPDAKAEDDKLSDSKIDTIIYRMNKYCMALFSMFDIMELTLDEKSTDKHWKVTRVKKTIFGNAIIINIFEALKKIQYNDSEHEQNMRLQALRKQFKSVCSNYQRDIEIKQSKVDDGEFIFKVSLGNVWRRFSVPVDYKISDFCNLILSYYEFDEDHLYTLEIKDRFGLTCVYEKGEATFSGKNAHDYQLKQTSVQPGVSITFIYDFGAMWEFNLICEAYHPEKRSENPRLIEKRGNAPNQYGY